MYHIANDVRAKKSATLIGTAVLQLAKKKNFLDITITDIQQKSGISRSTFYRLFDTTVDVLAFQCHEIVTQVSNDTKQTSLKTIHNNLLAFIQLWMDHVDLLNALVASNQIGILQESHRQTLIQITDYLNINENFEPQEIDYVTSMLTYLLPSALFVWIQHGEKESAEDVYKYIRNTIKILKRLYE